MKTIGIIGAMPSELKDIRAAQKEPTQTELAGFTFCESKVGENTLVSVCCGIGKVNAACCTQLLIDRFGADVIINTGIAGGMKHDIKVLEIVISTSVLPHDLDAHFLNDYPPYCGEFPADAELQRLAAEVCEEMGIVYHMGRIVSGDAFVTDSAVKTALIAAHDPYAVDMETAAVGQCAWRNGVPFVSVRCISDLADDEGEMSYAMFEERAARRVADIVLKVAAGVGSPRC